MNWRCTDEQTDIFKCFRDVAADTTHKDDALIECVAKDLNQSPEPMKGTVRLVDYENKISNNKKGRLELFSSSKWGTVCNKEFQN